MFGLKSSEGNKAVWELRGNKDRIAEIKAEELKIFSKLFTGSGSDWQASQLPRVHNKQISSLLAKFANSKTIREMFPKSTVESMFHESGAKQKGQIHRLDNPSFQPQTARDCILTGPLIYVGCPIYQNANTISKTHRAYSPIDLTEISEDFLPRTVYKPGKRDGSTEKFEEVMRQVGTNGQLGRSVVEDYRFAYKLQASLSGERTLIGTIVPREVSAVNTLMLMSFSNIRDLVRCTSLLCSLPLDFITKVKARAAIYEDDIKSLPVIDGIALDYAFNRMLRLTCLTKHFDSLWTYCFNRSFLRDRFVVDLEQLDSENSWDRLNSLWQSNFALKTDFGRRQAHLEIDALVAIGLGLSFDELESMYKIQFPVLQEYESVDEYDSKGRKLPNSTRKEPGQKEVVEARKDHDGISPLTVSWKLDGGKQTVTKTFYPPFTKVDRVEDYRQAWEVFTERFAKEKEKNVGSKC